jgi:hypothetical protein
MDPRFRGGDDIRGLHGLEWVKAHDYSSLTPGTHTCHLLYFAFYSLNYITIACRHQAANPSVTTGRTGRGEWPWPPNAVRFHPEGAACRGEAPPRPYVLVVYLHVIDGLEPSRY